MCSIIIVSSKETEETQNNLSDGKAHWLNYKKLIQCFSQRLLAPVVYSVHSVRFLH